MEYRNNILYTEPFYVKMEELFGTAALDVGVAITDVEASVREIMRLTDLILTAKTKEQAAEPLLFIHGEFEHILSHAEEACSELKKLLDSLE